jgi:hypothetical protein
MVSRFVEEMLSLGLSLGLVLMLSQAVLRCIAGWVVLQLINARARRARMKMNGIQVVVVVVKVSMS